MHPLTTSLLIDNVSTAGPDRIVDNPAVVATGDRLAKMSRVEQ
jgi:hypothetical protein